MTSTRQEILATLAEISELTPDIRLGQLMANLSYLAKSLSKDALWEVEDEELLEAARQHLEKWRAKRPAEVVP